MTGGGTMCATDLPVEVWQRIASALLATSVADLLSFRDVCKTSYEAVRHALRDRQRALKPQFGARPFHISPEIISRTILVHVVPPLGRSLFMIAEKTPPSHEDYYGGHSEEADGLELVWAKGDCVVKHPLEVPGLGPLTSVSNLKFSPDGRHIAILVTVDSGTALLGGDDPIGRLAGLEDEADEDLENSTEYEPSDECALVIAELQEDSYGNPQGIQLFIFGHAFVPEYGFDMRWSENTEDPELTFAGILHARKQVILYLARWNRFGATSEAAFQFISSIPKIGKELRQDKLDAMRTIESTRITSRIELSEDLKTLFFDTSSKFGVVSINHDEHVAAKNRLIPQAAVRHGDGVSDPFQDLVTQQISTPSSAEERRRSFLQRMSHRSSPSSVFPRKRYTGVSGNATNEKDSHFRSVLRWKKWFVVYGRATREKSSSGEDSVNMSKPENPKQHRVGSPVERFTSAFRNFFRKESGTPSPESHGTSVPWQTAGVFEENDGSGAVEGSIQKVMGQSSRNAPPSMGVNSAPNEGPKEPATDRVIDFSDSKPSTTRTSRNSLVPFVLQDPATMNSDQASTMVDAFLRPDSESSLESGRMTIAIGSPPQVLRPPIPKRQLRVRRLAFSKSSFSSTSPRVTCLSPDGLKLCSVYIIKLADEPTKPAAHLRCVEVRSTVTGEVLFRNCNGTATQMYDERRCPRIRFEKAHAVVANTCGFSADSSLVWVRDGWISRDSCQVTCRLPAVFRVSDGAVVQRFSIDDQQYMHLQMAPDGLTVYGTRFAKSTVIVDAVDVLTARVFKSEKVAGPMGIPAKISAHAVYLLERWKVRAVSRGNVDALWETTRGSIGCHWGQPFDEEG